MKTKQFFATTATAFLLFSSSIALTACNTGNVSTDGSNDTSASIDTNKTGIINISSAQLQTLLDKKVTLIDIRRPEEWAQTGVVAGSKKLTFFSSTGAINPQLVPSLKRIAPSDKPVALICRTGNRSGVAAQMISTQLGYKTVYNVKDGITKWIAEGRKTVK